MFGIIHLKNVPYRFLDIIHFPERNMPDTLDGMFRKATKEKRLIEIEYDEYKRVVETHIYGKKNCKEGILAYQKRGKSSSGILGWKRMYFQKMTKVRVLRERFPGKRQTSGKQSSWDEFYDIVDK